MEEAELIILRFWLMVMQIGMYSDISLRVYLQTNDLE
jgi:hypothetical protein